MIRHTSLVLALGFLCLLSLLTFVPFSKEVIDTDALRGVKITSWRSSIEEVFSSSPSSPPPPVAEEETIVGASYLNYSKVATMIETRDSLMLIPILQSWLANVPSDWPFVIWTSAENHDILTGAPCFERQIEIGRLNFTRIDFPGSPYLPDPAHTSTLSDLLANDNWFWTQFHPMAEWMLFFQIDSVLCSRSNQTVDDWIGYDFVGGPCTWSHGPGMDRHGGNGGLSMRRISSLRKLTTESPRQPDGEPEDVWFTRRLTDVQGTRWPDLEGQPSAQFSLSQGWMEDETDDDAWSPLGIHHGSMHMGTVMEPDADGRMTKELHRLVQHCPEFLYLRYELDEFKEVNVNDFVEVDVDDFGRASDASAVVVKPSAQSTPPPATSKFDNATAENGGEETAAVRKAQTEKHSATSGELGATIEDLPDRASDSSPDDDPLFAKAGSSRSTYISKPPPLPQVTAQALRKVNGLLD